jgi:PEP-CTERM motif
MRNDVKFALLGGVAFAALSGASALAGPIPYPNIGTPNPTTYTFTATSTGVITAFFDGSGASFEEVVGMSVNGAPVTVWGLDDHTSPVGTSIVMGSVVAGDTLTFFDAVYPGGIGGNVPPAGATYIWSSNQAMNSDGGNHVYSTSVTAGQAYAGSPAGVYVGFEDLKFPSSDFNYRDDTFVFTNTTVTPSVPEASTWAMMVAGFGGLGFAAFRRSRKASVAIA